MEDVVLQTFAVSVLTEKPGGPLRHTLCVVEASGLDVAEARVLHRLTKAGHLIRGLLSRPTHLTEEELVHPS